ncbi:MAG: DNA repair protein RadA [Nitrospirota bacterium]
MSNQRPSFSCQTCGYQSPKWMGRCPECGEWNSFLEERNIDGRWQHLSTEGEGPRKVKDVSGTEEGRILSGISEFDRILGGGVVRGGLVLIGGDPGIGKSTLLLQVLDRISRKGRKVLYISGEESQRQIKMRGERIGVSDDIYLLAETSLERVLTSLEGLSPEVAVVDSIQTIFSEGVQSVPGSISQIREIATRLMFYAKRANVSIFIIGHVTKDGSFAGPKALEHIVDTVLYFEGDKSHPYRILRTIKNRFGSTNEIGVFEMRDSGLEEVQNPSEMFLAERPSDIAGSVVVSSLEGTRPILVELQALVSPTPFGISRRMSIGVDPNRVSLLLAILEKRGGLHLQGQDIFVNVVGGMMIDEPAADLGIVLAVASSFKEKPINEKTLVFGEVGLGGEIRAITQAGIRVKEASKMGFKKCLLPENNTKGLNGNGSMQIIGVSHINEALEALLV